MKHPKTCFGISRHNVIIPIKVTNVEDLGDDCYGYTFEINHPKPSEYMKLHQQVDFNYKIVSEDAPLCGEYTKFHKTLEDAKNVVKATLIEDRASAMLRINAIDKELAEIDATNAELEAL